MIVEKAENIFDKIHRSDFEELANIASLYDDISSEELCKYYDDKNQILEDLKKEWEKSLEEDAPNYSVYGHPAYLNESFVCWKTYSRKYVKLIKQYLKTKDCEINVGEVENILDMGCGCAYSTIALKAVFPNAHIIASNIKDTLQYKIDKYVTDNIDGCDIIDEKDTFNLEKIDMIFASEFFEHLVSPIDLLSKIIQTYKPKYIIFANTFTQMAIGHFKKYNVYGKWEDGHSTSRAFNKCLRLNGYCKIDTGFFNNRPNIYKLCGENDSKNTRYNILEE